MGGCQNGQLVKSICKVSEHDKHSSCNAGFPIFFEAELIKSVGQADVIPGVSE